MQYNTLEKSFFFSTQVRINLHADTPDITTNTNNLKDQIL